MYSIPNIYGTQGTGRVAGGNELLNNRQFKIRSIIDTRPKHVDYEAKKSH